MSQLNRLNIPDSAEGQARGSDKGVLRLFRRLAGILLSDPLTARRRSLHIEEGSRASRIFRAILYRLALLPAAAILAATGLVYLRTHPPQPTFTSDPLSAGVYFQPVILQTEDHVQLEGWLAPALDAGQVVSEHEAVLKKKWPAVVLAHGYGMTRQQMLPLFRPLHEGGWIVLAIGMRGSGSLVASGQTFGLNESLDIKAAVQMLRRLPAVDGGHMALVGVGTGANAALLAAARDGQVSALVLDAPADSGDQAFSSHVYSMWPALKVLNPLCELAFQLGYGLNIRDLDMDRYGGVLAARPTLLTRWTPDAESDLSQTRVNQIVDFLDGSIGHPQARASIEP